MTDNDPAVAAAAEALETHYASGYFCRCGVEVNSVFEHMASAAVAAARPIIEAEVRESIAADIDAADAPGRPTDWSLDEGLTIASRIARGEQ